MNYPFRLNPSRDVKVVSPATTRFYGINNFDVVIGTRWQDGLIESFFLNEQTSLETSIDLRNGSQLRIYGLNQGIIPLIVGSYQIGINNQKALVNG